MMFCFALRALCGSSKIELKMTDNEIFDEIYKKAASENKHTDKTHFRMIYFGIYIHA
jgi:hypothetical protein